MALTDLQRTVCRLLADLRRGSGESYVAGGVALNELLGGDRLSRDVGLFHDTEEAVDAAWRADREQLADAGFEVRPLRQRPGFVEASVERGGDSVRIEWARDSAFRFFPLVEHEELGLALHPFDLATNKLLALIGRHEVRDWVDLLACDRGVQPLGYLAWAACGKDPAFSPASILDHAARNGRFTAVELAELEFAGPPPEAAELAERWHAALDDGREIVARLPAEESGGCVLHGDDLCRLDAVSLTAALAAGGIRYRSGSIGGALPTFRP